MPDLRPQIGNFVLTGSCPRCGLPIWTDITAEHPSDATRHSCRCFEAEKDEADPMSTTPPLAAFREEAQRRMRARLASEAAIKPVQPPNPVDVEAIARMISGHARCRCCDGSGIVVPEDIYRTCPDEDIDWTCPNCDGTGYAAEVEPADDEETP